MSQKIEHASSSHLATAGGFGAILLWSTTVALARSLSEQVGPLTASAAVFSVSGVISIVVCLLVKRKRRQIMLLPLKYIAGCGTLFAGYMLLLFLAIGWSIDRQQALVAGLLNYTWPALTLLLSLVLLGKKASWLLLPGTFLALAGVFLVFAQGATISWGSVYANLSGNPAPYVLALGAGVAWALYSNLTRRWAGGRQQGAVVVFLPLTAVILLSLCWFFNEPREWNLQAAAETLFLGCASYFGYMLWDNAMRMGNVIMVAAGSYLTPLFSTIVSCVYLAIMPGAELWIGCCILIAGSVLSWLSTTDAIPQESAQPAGAGDVL